MSLATGLLLPVECASVLRRAAAAGDVSGDVASQAHADLLRLPIQLLGYEAFAERAWELRADLTPYDAWYVAIAEAVVAPLVTLDRRLARAGGSACAFLLPG